MTRKLLLPLAAGVVMFGAAALVPAPASAQMSSAAAVIDLNVKDVSNVVEVGRRDRRRHRHWRPRHHGRWSPHPRFWRPHAWAPRRCGYVWSWRRDRHVWRCW